jgi:CheY-like chemotaxis protein
LKTTPVANPSHELLTVVDTSARRAAELTAQLLSFSRRQPLRLKPMRLDRTIDEARLILRPAIDPRVRINTKVEPGLWAVLADPAQMTSVLVNLGLNARDAMPSGGELLIELANVSIDEAYRAAHVYAECGEHVRLSVEDTGRGMPPDVVGRVFEPFFTTKPPGSGTGLGLAMVYGTVKAHGGWITCQSTLGVGTRFEIFLPRTLLDEPAAAPQPMPEASAPVEQRQTILLVDDEPAIRTLGKRVLETQGYRVLLAEDGLDALETYSEMQREIGLVVLDLTMPRLSGRDTLKRLREIDPTVRVLLSSGYSVDQVQDTAWAVGFVSKPYRPEELARAVRNALGKEP